MKTGTIIKLLIFNIALAIIDIILFSERLVGLSWKSDSAVGKALFLTFLFGSIFAFFYMNYLLLFSKTKNKIERLTNSDDIKAALSHFRKESGIFQNELNQTIDQLDLFERRKKTLDKLLQENFQHDSNLYAITNLTDDLENNLYSNIRKMMKRLSIFDTKEYLKTKNSSQNIDTELYYRKQAQFKEHIEYIKKQVNKNEERLLEFENLLTEISHINDSDEVNDLSKIKDMVNAMQQLHKNQKDNDISNLMSKYEGGNK